ncbi:hypothetical protein CEN49_17360 [Fischerella thermalis CCMEE 5273]|uniref:Uncharacterized protein n=2 Tax=Fischerella TaxID=1190 RepID=A0A1U7H2I2_9CYAN|nr:hypothetical protein NIES592_04120 [Fischerella major NIES-592]PLZ11147.1 hypothetical protein CBP18_08805 [Fischerella thermalis WC119]PLZ15299.1 hypothetical protein CBP17_02275 [Fischerella thermalis WC114]PLZ20136.1 hypothetical protein CBP19_00570 [Fischerella thermalis WC1110]PLZ24021.1 hypothetical protein CBP28_18015 [Fischerella thermalis WC559]PLZ24126.1 hypothetical protein CBP30_02065 [Fischerella thermalis WC157]PLZ27545.1 hypothetical protein CBP10_18935 [Fischerella thermali
MAVESANKEELSRLMLWLSLVFWEQYKSLHKQATKHLFILQLTLQKAALMGVYITSTFS